MEISLSYTTGCEYRRELNRYLNELTLDITFPCSHHNSLVRSKKTSKLRATGLCAGNSPVTGEFPAQMASNADVSIWWRHHSNNTKHIGIVHGVLMRNLNYPSRSRQTPVTHIYVFPQWRQITIVKRPCYVLRSRHPSTLSTVMTSLFREKAEDIVNLPGSLFTER